jgi:hypothetical protein
MGHGLIPVFPDPIGFRIAGRHGRRSRMAASANPQPQATYKAEQPKAYCPLSAYKHLPQMQSLVQCNFKDVAHFFSKVKRDFLLHLFRNVF